MSVTESSGIIIQQMGLQDIAQVELLIVELNLGYWTQKDLEQEIFRTDSITLIAKKEKEIAGFIIARLITNMNAQPNYKSKSTSIKKKSANEFEIYNIAVVENFRRRKIGKLLIKELLKYTVLEKHTILWLEVRESNTPAINFYKSNSFAVCYKRKNFYNNPIEDALVMKYEVVT